MTRDQRRQLVKGLASAVALGLVLVGPPIFLALALGWPLPTTIPSLDEIQTALTIGFEYDVVLKGLALVAWVAWAFLALSVLVEVIAKIHGHAARALPGLPGGVQVTIGRLVGSAALTVTSFGPLHGAPPVAADPAVELVVLPEPPPQTDPAPDDWVSMPGTESENVSADTGRPATRLGTPAARTVVVGRHDSYWAIAERTLGDPLRWTEIRDLNVGRTMADGKAVTSTSEHPAPGWELVLPADAHTAASAVDNELLPDRDVSPTETTEGEVPSSADSSPPQIPASPANEQVPAPVGGGQHPGPVEVTIQPGDNMWNLAEGHLTTTLGRPVGPPEVAPYWQHFVETNRGRLVDPDNPNLIYPGQTLVFPATGPDEPVAAAAGVPPDAPSAPPEPSSCPTPSRTNGETQDPASVDTSLPAAPDGTVPEETGDQEEEASSGLDKDPSPTPHPTVVPDAGHDGEVTEAPSGPREAEQTRSTPGNGGSTDGQDDALPGPAAVTVAGAVATALAVGVVEAIRRRRRRRNHVHPGTNPAPSVDPALHRQLVVHADGDAHHCLRHALDQLAVGIVAKGYRCRPRIVLQGPEHLDVLLDQATSSPPDGWQAQATAQIWARTADGLAADRCGTLRPNTLAPTPLLVTLGQPDDGGQLYLDLEAASVVALTGDLEVALGVARGFVAELASSPLAETAQILAVGDIGGPVRNLDRVNAVESWDQSGRDLTTWADGTREAIAARGWPNSFVGRSHGTWDDALMPLVVVAATPPDDPKVLDELLADGPAAVAAVVVGQTVDGAFTIECHPDQLVLPQLGLTCQPQPVTAEFIEGVVDLLDQADGTSTGDAERAADEPGPDDFEVAANSNGGAADPGRPYEDPPFDVLIRVLGDITVEGGHAPLTPKQTALVTYLALHDGPDTDRLAEALWATSSPAGSHRKRLGNAIGECRRILGNEHLPPAVDGRYKVGSAVFTDIDLWDQRVKAAVAQPPDLAAQTLQGAVDLIRGPIFTCRNADRESYAWVDVENWVAIWEKKITSVAQHLAELYLDLGQADGAAAVSEHVLRAIPTDTAITETLMRAHAANGDQRSIKRVYQAHVNALEQLDLDDPAESTLDLFDELRGGTAD